MNKYDFAAIVCTALIAMEGMAIYKGVDGVYFMPIVALVSAIAGALLGFDLNLFSGLKNEIKKEDPDPHKETACNTDPGTDK